MNEKQAVFHPIISSIQKIALYETRSRFYLMGSNNTQTKFRVLKIDRLEPRELSLVDDNMEYSKDEIRDLVAMIDVGNRNRAGNGVSRVISAFGIVGFVRFLEGYYIILVTKRRKVCTIGHHTVYKIEDTSMIYIPSEGILKYSAPEEARYVKMFQSIDMSSNFYFSYSYDITHTLQSNLAPPVNVTENGVYGFRNKPNEKFVWNSHLLSQIKTKLHPDWLLYIMHGFIGQSNVSIFGRSVYVTVIARRSSKYAGTRFLKRGGNFQGDVGNEVETEQMVNDSSISSLNHGRFSSFVQLRGSIPAQWSQDMSKMVPKPTISFDLSDPFAETAGEHFNQLLKRYGAPIIILNLVKKREKKKHESSLSQEFSQAVGYLNQFLPPAHRVQYVSFDMARVNKGTANVMSRLAGLARNAILKTGIFHSQPTMKTMQTGILRVNCVDCLDRTNTAQFAVGKCALAFQLHALGVLESPQLEFDSDCVRMLEELYEDHGDTLALQYGGSQLVHRIKTYRKTAPWTSQGNDIMQTLSRYYSNTFSDTEKQNTMNLFLGLFIPEENKPAIWDQFTDYYLHHPVALGVQTRRNRPMSQWWESDVITCLPLALDQVSKTCDVLAIDGNNEMIDSYDDYHRSYELTVLTDMYAYKMSHSVKDFMPHFTTNYSPFTVRIRPGRRREETLSKSGSSMKNPSLSGQSSTSSTTSSTSSGEASDESDNEESLAHNDQHSMAVKDTTSENITYESLFPTVKQVYGTSVEKPQKPDIRMYKRFMMVGLTCSSKRVTREGSCSAKDKSIYSVYVDRGIDGAKMPSDESMNQYYQYVAPRALPLNQSTMSPG